MRQALSTDILVDVCSGANSEGASSEIGPGNISGREEHSLFESWCG
jgi:hypothetical protein